MEFLMLHKKIHPKDIKLIQWSTNTMTNNLQLPNSSSNLTQTTSIHKVRIHTVFIRLEDTILSCSHKTSYSETKCNRIKC